VATTCGDKYKKWVFAGLIKLSKNLKENNFKKVEIIR